MAFNEIYLTTNINRLILHGIILSVVVLTACNINKPVEKQKPSDKMITASVLKQLTAFDSSTKIILIRHAEKQAEVSNPGLTSEGKSRANKLVALFKDTELNAIYSTNYNRTKNTVEALGNDKKITLRYYEGNDLSTFAKQLMKNHENQTILIVGHSNTTPDLIQALLESKIKEVIEHDDYDNFYLITAKEVGDGTLANYKY